MTADDARKVCEFLASQASGRDTGFGQPANNDVAERLKSSWPEFNWRVILDRSGERTRWRITIDDNDPREHFFTRLGGKCIHCGQTSRELSVEHDYSNTEEELIDALSERT